MAARISQELAVSRMVAAMPDFDYSLFIYTGAMKNGIVVCRKHGAFTSTYQTIIGGHGCPKCKGENCGLRNLNDPATVVQRMMLRRPDYDFSAFKYAGNKVNSTIVCSRHGEFQSSYSAIMRGRGCYSCGVESRTKKRTLPKDEAVARMKAVFPGYGYSQFEYKTSGAKSTFICPTHGPFLSSYNFVVNGIGCVKCTNAQRALDQRVPFLEFVRRAHAVHDNAYSYVEATYTGMSDPVVACCTSHGLFRVACGEHVYGQGCPDCKDTRFNSKKRAFFYICRLSKDGVDYVGYGITGNPERRDAEHKRRAASVGFVCERTHLFRFRRGHICRDVETLVSNTFESVDLGVRGFKKETATWDNYDALVSLVESSASKFGSVSDISFDISRHALN